MPPATRLSAGVGRRRFHRFAGSHHQVLQPGVMTAGPVCARPVVALLYRDALPPGWLRSRSLPTFA